MKPEEIKAFFQSIYSTDNVLYSPEMPDKFYAHATPDMVFHRAPFPGVAGIEANRQSDEAMAATFSENKVHIDDLIVEGDTAVLRYTWEADHTGVSPAWVFHRLESTSRPWGAWCLTGRMTRWWSCGITPICWGCSSRWA